MLFLSRIDPKKGLDTLLDALAAKAESTCGWTLVVVGDGAKSYVTQIEEKAKYLREKLPPIVWHRGIWGADRWAFFQGADLFVLPSHSENFGIAVLESAHAGTPILTTDATPWEDHRNVDGIHICKPNSQSLEERLVALLPQLPTAWNSTRRLNLSSWATSEFSWDALAPRYEAAYKSVTNISKAARGRTPHVA
jgi:glycosyltransferase involved in cell wall biosynthesis